MKHARPALLAGLAFASGCARSTVASAPAAAGTPTVTAAHSVSSAVPTAPLQLASALQIVMVTTARWDTTGGALYRYERDDTRGPWRAVGAAVPVVVGRTGLAWGDDALARSASEPTKHEGDGRAPAGAFPLDTLFGFAPSLGGVRMPYVALTSASECVDDVASAHYNTVVDRGAVPSVDWKSSEPMRRIEQYREGVIVGYNSAPVRAGRGSCIFLHIWAGPGTSTAGCTAIPASELAMIVRWLDRARRPMLVQLPEPEYERFRGAWALPSP